MEIDWEPIIGNTIPDARKDQMVEELMELMSTLQRRSAQAGIPWVFGNGLNTINFNTNENTMIVVKDNTDHFMIFDCKVRAKAKIKKPSGP